jgi:photosystem II stability/assembly factor-like uncharacterized protein
MKKGLIPLLLFGVFVLNLCTNTHYLRADNISKPFELKNPLEDITVTAICFPSLIVDLDADGQYVLDPSEVDNGSNSDVGSVTLSLNITTFDCSNLSAPVTVTLTVEDTNLDQATCTSEITVVDNIAPVVECPSNTIDVGDGTAQSVDPSYFIDSSSDNCSTVLDFSFLEPFSGWVEESSASTSNLEEVFFIDSNTGWIVGNTGSIQHTTDGGVTWATQSSGSTSDLKNVFFTNAQNGFAVGFNETLLVTSDGGLNWSSLAVGPGLGSIFYSVFFVDSTNGFIAGTKGVLLQTIDGGLTWTDESSGILDFNRDVFFSDLNNGWLVGRDTILHTTDGGTNWTLQSYTEPSYLKKVVFVDNTTGWIVGDNGIVLHTTDAGSNWNIQSSTTTENLNDIGMYSSTSGYISGRNGVLLFTSDAGQNWTASELPNNSTIDLQGLAVLAQDDATVVGGINTIFSYFDGSVLTNTLEFDCNDVGSNSIDIQVSDAQGNSTICSTVLNVGDDVKPVAQCKTTVDVDLDTDGNYVFNGTELDNGSFDLCTSISFEVLPLSVDCSVSTAQTVTLTVSDDRGNSDFCTSTVNVIDNENPNPICQDVNTDLDGNGTFSLSAADVDGGSTDNCPAGLILSITSGVESYDCSNIGTPETVELTVTDQSGNSEVCTAVVTVNDNEAPLIECQDFIVDIGLTGAYQLQNDDVLLSYTDNCTDILFVEFSQSEFDCDDIGDPVTINVSVEDDNLQSSTCQALVTVVDTELPVLECVNSFAATLNTLGVVSVVAADLVTNASDACSLNALNPALFSFDCSSNDNEDVIISISDTSGNTQSCTVNISITDDENPVAVCYEEVEIILDSSGNATIQVSDVLDQVSDNCPDGLSYEFDNELFSCEDVGLNTVVTLTVSDESGNQGTCSTSVSVLDNLLPQITCEDLILTLGDSGMASAEASDFIAQSSDNCDLTFSADVTDFSCDDSGIIVNVFASDGTSQSTCTSIVTLVDDLAPEIVCQDFDAFIVNADGYIFDENDALVSAEDNCGIVNYVVSNTVFECDQVGEIIELTLIASDAANLSDTCTFNLTLLEEIAPVISCQGHSLILDDNGVGTLQEEDVLISASDNCGFFTTELSQTEFDCTSNSVNPVTVTVTDQFENESVCTVQVSILDQQVPTIVCLPVFTVNLDPVDGTASVSSSDLLTDFSDNCGISQVNLSKESFNCLDTEVDVTVTAIDDSMNSASCMTTVFIVDNTPPTIVCNDFELEMPLAGFAAITFADVVTATDNCFISDYDLSESVFECSSESPQEIIVTVEDIYENQSTCTSVITIVDLIVPVAVCQSSPIELSLGSDGLAEISVDDIDGGSFDNCDNLNLTLSQATFGCEDIGENEVTLTVMDAANLQDSCTVIVEVEDNQNPIANCVQLLELELDSDGEALLEVSDIDDGSSDNCGGTELVLSHTSFNCSSSSPTLVTLTVTDESENSVQCNTLVSIVDLEAPTLECLQSTLIVELDPSGQAVINENDVVVANTDNCQANPVSISQSIFNCSDIGDPIQIDITSSDDAGNENSCTVIVEVEDNFDPLFTCQDVEISLNEFGEVNIGAGDIIFGLFDPCGIGEVTLSKSSFNCSNVGINEVFVSISDLYNNIGFCSVDVTIIDDLAPIVQCQDTSINLDFAGQGSINFEDVFLGSADNCSIVSNEISQTEFDCSHVGITEVEITAIDEFDNIGTCVVNVEVIDNISPTGLCPNSLVRELGDNCSYILEDFESQVSMFDNCEAPIAFFESQTPIAGTVLTEVGEIELEFIVEDANGNQGSCFTNLIINDLTPPTAVCTDMVLALDNDGLLTIPLDLIAGSSFDNCSEELLFTTNAPTQYTCSDLGTYAIEISVEDQNGLSSSCTATVEIIDNIAPEAECLSYTVYLDEDGEGIINEDDIDNMLLSVIEACDLDAVSIDIDQVDCSDVEPIPYTLSLTDINGNIGICSNNLIVEDTLNPTLICKPVGDVNLNSSGVGSISAEDIILIANDECEIDLITISDSFFTCEDIGVHDVTVTVFDNFGNSSSCVAEVDVEDSAGPELECVDLVIELPADGSYFLELETVLISASDFCSDLIDFDYGPNLFDCSNVGFNTVFVTGTDEYGNSTTCNTDFILIDVTEPVAVCEDLEVELDADGEFTLSSDDYAPLSVDNCANLFVDPPVINLNCSNIAENTFEVIVSDLSGQSDTCTSIITVNDLLPPLFDFNDTLVIFLDSDGNATVNVDQFDLGTTDNCGFFSLSFENQIAVSEVSFDCDNEGFNPFTVWATDTEGNQSSSNVWVEIIQSGACDPTIEEFSVAGQVSREDDIPTPDVTINLSNGFSQLTDDNGEYSFVVLADSSYTITPFRDGDYTNGVSTFDVALIQAVILGISTFDSPYKYIAADVNNSGAISTFDLIIMQKNILSIDSGFGANTSWRFVDASYEFSDPHDPWAGGPFPESIVVPSLNSDILNNDFVAIKIGDVNLNSEPFNDNSVSGRNSKTLQLNVEDQYFNAGEQLFVSLDQTEISPIAGQFEISYDPSVLGLSSIGGIHLTDDSYRINEVNGVIRVSFVNFDQVLDASIIQLEFETIKTGKLSDVLALEESRLHSELISPDFDVYGLDLIFSDKAMKGFVLDGVFPNPFNERVQIEFSIEESDVLELEIRDQSGRVVHRESKSCDAGKNTFTIRDLKSKGLLIFELKGSKGHLFGKMIKQ